MKKFYLEGLIAYELEDMVAADVAFKSALALAPDAATGNVTSVNINNRTSSTSNNN